MITKYNFYTRTRATFTPVNKPNRKPDYVSKSSMTGKVSSSYWYTNDGVIRESNHWGGVASCMWSLKGFSTGFLYCEVSKTNLIGYVSFEEMNNTTNEFEILNSKKMKVLSSEYWKLEESKQSFVNAGSTKKGKKAIEQFNKEMKKLFKLK